MISYFIKHHIRGRIRIEVPLLKKMTPAELKKLADTISIEPRPKGIKGISANPLTGSVTIRYDADALDIMAYLSHMVTNKEILNIVRQGYENEPYEKCQ
jgi:hypothetical protein